MKIKSILASLLLASSCTAESPKTNDATMVEFIDQLLVELLEKPEGSFLILSVKNSENYVQFAGSREEALLFDFPTMQLNGKQLSRTKEFFKTKNMVSEDLELTTEPGGERAGTLNTFNQTFDRNTKEAATLAAEILHEIFQISSPDQIKPKKS